MSKYVSPVMGLSMIRSRVFLEHVEEHQRELLRTGYSRREVRPRLHAIAHLGVWLELQGRQPEDVDEKTIEAFEHHRPKCRCLNTSRNRSRMVVSWLHRFLRHLRGVGGVRRRTKPRSVFPPLVKRFLRWMKVHRGVVKGSLTRCGDVAHDLVQALGEHPEAYTAHDLRTFLEGRCRGYRVKTAQGAFSAVRMFLRYLAVEGKCRPGLERALPSPAQWSMQPLPRGLTPQEVESVFRHCPQTQKGIRDRAVLLLLVRLGLRAGDVAKLRFSDISFDMATIAVSGKSRRETRLPLPQEVGDALLAYIRSARPRVSCDSVFLRLRAPFGPLSGHGITILAGAALKRAGVKPPKSGAHVFRHTAACQMLRSGVGLEGIAAVLRHRSVATTGIYAKVDLDLLQQVAQPWPEVA